MREGSGHTGKIQSPLGSALKRRRLALGLSQEELANRAGLHRTYITDVERGSRNPSLETIQKLARALEVPLSDVFLQIESGTGAPGSPAEGDAVEILIVDDDRGGAGEILDELKSNNFTNTVHVIRDGADALDFVFSTGSYRGRSHLEIPRL
ncbi:MAG TPA: helix-turn-helix domain-containing protein, partial [Bacteroidota bacterium]|nr:helix-turn-helix domain-containing protein [Bacteroidota bacterium]